MDAGLNFQPSLLLSLSLSLSLLKVKTVVCSLSITLVHNYEFLQLTSDCDHIGRSTIYLKDSPFSSFSFANLFFFFFFPSPGSPLKRGENLSFLDEVRCRPNFMRWEKLSMMRIGYSSFVQTRFPMVN